MEVVQKLLRGSNLSYEEAYKLFTDFFACSINTELTGAILVALNYKGITPEELAGAISASRDRMIRVDLNEDVIDTCGTGGDGKRTLNISTATSIILRALGQKVAKHGNRKITGFIGSIDVAERLGLPVASDPDTAKEIFKEKGYVLLFARAFHPAFSKFAELRQLIGVPTIFNVLGPLINPANPSSQLIGVFSPGIMKVMAEALFLLGDFDRVIVHDKGGFDEITGSDEVLVYEVRKEGVKSYRFNPLSITGSRLTPPIVTSEDEAIE
ncbi:MAG: anthranilate phosphoribosyltransferase, partial [Thermosulfidibacteraceae bacterium]